MAPAFKISDAPQIDRKGLCETKERERGGFAVGTNDQHSCVCVCVGKERLFLTSS